MSLTSLCCISIHVDGIPYMHGDNTRWTKLYNLIPCTYIFIIRTLNTSKSRVISNWSSKRAVVLPILLILSTGFLYIVKLGLGCCYSSFLTWDAYMSYSIVLHVSRNLFVCVWLFSKEFSVTHVSKCLSKTA